jgi:hypothetical protein
MEKKEYMRQLKQLIKKYHPDLCTDENLEIMYNEITIKLTNILNKLKANENQDNQFTKIKEQDYELYKLGIKYYKNIHTDKFYKKSDNGTYQTKTYEELVSALNSIFLSFELSEYYFNKLIEEYPQSLWYNDAMDKVNFLKRLHKRYKNMNLEENKMTNYLQFVNEMGLNVV